MKCVWCLRDRELLPNKKFCNECNLNGKECIRCHRPMPPKFYVLHSQRCNSCHKKYEKEKLKRLFVNTYVKPMYIVIYFFRMATRRLRNDHCEERQVRKICRTQSKASTGSPKVEILHVHPKHLEEVLLEGTRSQHGWRSNPTCGKEGGHGHDVQRMVVQKLHHAIGEGKGLPQPLLIRLGESHEDSPGDQQKLTRRHSMPDLCQSDEVCEAVQRSSEGKCTYAGAAGSSQQVQHDCQQPAGDPM